MPAAPDDPLTTLAAAADGLLVPSEHDYPLELFRWDGGDPLTPAALVASLGLPPDTPVETRDLATFFAPLTRTADGTDAAAQATAARFVTLRAQVAAVLTDVVVYRVGRIQITALIVGRTAAGVIGGLRTTLIET